MVVSKSFMSSILFGSVSLLQVIIQPERDEGRDKEPEEIFDPHFSEQGHVDTNCPAVLKREPPRLVCKDTQPEHREDAEDFDYVFERRVIGHSACDAKSMCLPDERRETLAVVVAQVSTTRSDFVFWHLGALLLADDSLTVPDVRSTPRVTSLDCLSACLDASLAFGLLFMLNTVSPDVPSNTQY